MKTNIYIVLKTYRSLCNMKHHLSLFSMGTKLQQLQPSHLVSSQKRWIPLRNSYLYAHGDEGSSPRPTFKRIQVPEKSKNVIEIESQDNLKLVSCITQETYRSGILNMQLKFLGDFQDWELEGVRESFQARRMKCR